MASNDRDILKSVKREDIPGIDEDNDTLIRFAKALFIEAQEHKVNVLKLHEKWTRARNWIDGKQWEKERGGSYLSKPVTNFIFSNCETIQALIANTRPILEIEMPNFEKAQEIRQVIDNNLWYRLRIPRIRKLVMKDFVQLGNGFIKPIWDPFALDGQGELSINYTDPYSLFPQPHQTELQDMKYIFHAFPMYISELVDRFGDIALGLTSEDVTAKLKKKSLKKQGLLGRLAVQLLSPVTDTKGIRTDQFLDASGISQVVGREKDQVLFHELWYKDSRTEEVDFPDNEALEERTSNEHVAFDIGNSVSVNVDDDHKGHINKHRQFLSDNLPVNDSESDKLARIKIEEHIENHEAFPERSRRIKYKGGRVISYAQNILFDDKENPFKHGRFPWAHYKNYERGDEFWADGEVEQMMSPQLIHNRVEANIVDHAIIMGNSPWIVSEEAGVDEDTLVNAQGAIITVTGDVNTALRRDPPPSLPAYMPQILQFEKQGAEIVSGIHDVTQGRRPTGITSGKAIESLQAAGRTRITPKVEQVMYGDQELYEQMLKLMGQFYTEERLFLQIGDDGTQQRIVLSPKDLQEDMVVRLRSRDELGASIDSRFQIALMLLQTGAMTPDLMLEYLDLPGFSVLAKKYRERVGIAEQLGPLAEGNNGQQGAQNKNPAGELIGQQKLGTNLPGA